MATFSLKLTERQQEILDYLYSYVEGHGHMPTIRVIGEYFKLASPNGAMSHLRALHRKRELVRVKGDGRMNAYTLPQGSPVVTLKDGVLALRVPGRLKVRLTVEEAQTLAESLESLTKE